MKILLFHQYYLEENDSGGSRWNEITKMWSDQGHTITVLGGMVHYATGKKADRYKGKFVFTDVKNPNLTVYRSHVSEAYNVNFIGRLWAYFSFVFSSIYTGIFKARHQYDVIIVTSPPLFLGISAYIISRIKRVPYLFEIRDLWPESAIDTGVVTNPLIIKISLLLEKFIYKKATLINVLTPAFKKKLIENKNISPTKIVMIPNAADFSISEELLQNFDPSSFRKQHGLENKFVVTYVGAHGVANHLIQMIETAEILNTTNSNIHFVLIGEGMQKLMLQAEAQNRGLTNITFFPAVSKKEVFKYILASDIGASVLKKVDTFKTVYSNKTFDYMACKKPILMAIDGVSRELVEEANCGVYIEPENPKDFAEKIIFYANNPEILKQQGQNGYDFAKINYDRNTLADKYFDIIEKLVQKV